MSLGLQGVGVDRFVATCSASRANAHAPPKLRHAVDVQPSDHHCSRDRTDPVRSGGITRDSAVTLAIAVLGSRLLDRLHPATGRVSPLQAPAPVR